MLNLTSFGLVAFAMTIGNSAIAQQPTITSASATPASYSSSSGSVRMTGAPTDSAKADSGKKEPKTSPQSVSLYRPAEIDHIRPADMRGLNVFEPPKQSTVPFTGFALSFGGAFTQEFQGLRMAAFARRAWSR
ncbi:MAG TPA: hypothetical protein VGM50_12805 [Gemmatimonadaceae bacterium]|jgi:hypothetical protein